MAHFAELDKDNFVIRVLVTDNNDPNGDEGYQFLLDTFGGRWLKTSYNTLKNQHSEGGEPSRGNFAGIGYSYDETLDIFLMPKPFNSWVVDEEFADWKAPVPRPDIAHVWNESALAWELSEPPYPSWFYSPELGSFTSPVERPTDGKLYRWDEELVNWELIETEESNANN